MRLDYVLYGLGIVFFGLSAVFYFLFSGDNQLLSVAIAVVVGILLLGVGLAQRPSSKASPVKAVTEPVPAPVVSEPVATEPVVQGPTETVKSAPDVIEPPKAAPTSEATATVEAPPAAQEPTSTPQAPASDETPASPFAQIRGINEKRTEQLKANGINSLQDLANAPAEELATKVGVSPKIVKMWIGQAKKLIK